MNYEKLLREMVHPKTKKPLQVRCAHNDWLVQVVVENKLWNSCYFAKPPGGIPEFVAETMFHAEVETYRLAYESAQEWVASLTEGTDTQ